MSTGQQIANLSREGLWTNNPAMVQMLGLCPLLAVSSSLVTSLGLGLVTLFVLTCANTLISLLRHRLDAVTRLPAQIMVIATFVTCADILLQAWFFELHQRIGLFVALIVTNCTLLARSESFARRNPVLLSAVDGFMMGAGFALVMLVLGAVRELLGRGTLFADMHLLLGPAGESLRIDIADTGLLLVLLPPGAFITFGLLIALHNVINQYRAKPAPHARGSLIASDRAS